jgi:nucleotide-binding universal stress UspA family protein
LLRHLGADVTLLTVLPASPATIPSRSRVEKFLANGAQSLSLLGLAVQTQIRSGAVAAEVIAEAQSGNYDLLVFGAPMANEAGVIHLSGPLEHIIQQLTNLPILIVRAELAIEDQFRFRPFERTDIHQEENL